MKKMLMTCLIGISVFTCGTSSFGDSSSTLQDSNGSVLETGKAYCIRPTIFEPRVNITVDDSRYMKLSDRSLNCEYAYKLVGDDCVNNRAVTNGETVRFEEMKKESDGTYRKTNNFLKADRGQYISSTENEYIRVLDKGRILPALKKSYEVAKFRVEFTSDNVSALQIKYKENYVWKVPYTVEAGEKWIELQDQNDMNGITIFEFEPVQ